jgi:hypothetical protein
MMERMWHRDAFPGVLHPGVGRLWDEVFHSVYASDSILSAVGPDALNDAYLMTWMVLWFQTSSATGAVLGCQPVDVEPPSGCEPIDPASLGPAATLPGRPSMGSERRFDWGLFMAILGFLFGIWGAFAAGLHDIIESMPDDEDWGEFRCYVYWWRMYLINALNTLHELSLFYAFRYPYSWELNQGNDTLPLPRECPSCGTLNSGTQPTCTNCGAALPPLVRVPYDVGWRLVRSRDVRQSFPARLPVPATVAPICEDIFDAVWWIFHPVRSDVANLCVLYEIENPQTTAYMRVEYPVFFVDGNPLRDGENDVKTGGVFPFREQTAGGEPVEFGSAVANAVDLFRYVISEPEGALPDWNLDADRGMAYLAWRFRDDIYTNPVNIVPES